MNSNNKLLFASITIFILLFGVTSCTTEPEITIDESVKLSLRDVGHQLLLTNQDSTSLVKPIIALKDYKYQLAFENQLEIHPDSLVSIIKNSFEKTNLPQHYLLEVLQCKDDEVAYSFQINKNVEQGIIPCKGRQLYKGCYLITVRFTKGTDKQTSNTNYLYLLLIGVLSALAIVYFKRKPKTVIDNKNNKEENQDNPFEALGRFKFYPEQNKLIKEATEISLSNKECELLSLFIEKPNQVIKREELTKKVWEDNGVIVGRSLDTYISKLRKKLQEDTSIKITNVHGVGYKLEIED